MGVQDRENPILIWFTWAGRSKSFFWYRGMEWSSEVKSCSLEMVNKVRIGIRFFFFKRGRAKIKK